MKNFNQFMEAVLIAKVVPTSDAVAPVETCDSCGNKPKDNFNAATDDFMKQMGFNDEVDAEGTQDIMQPDDGVGESGEVESEGESTSNVELNCLGEEGLEVNFNGMKFVLPTEVIEAIKDFAAGDGVGHEENETSEEHEEHESNETPAEEKAEHAEGGSESNETEQEDDEDGKKNPFTEAKKVNPWAVCTSSVGRDKKSKFENCVMDVKKKNKIKK